jgi:hypothetical protein
VNVHVVQVASSERFRAGSIKGVRALPPTIWWRWGEGATPGVTRLFEVEMLVLTIMECQIKDVDSRIEPLDVELRTGEPQEVVECGGTLRTGRRRQKHQARRPKTPDCLHGQDLGGC